MTRKLLIEAVEEAAEKCDCSFHTGFEYRIAAQLKKLPAVWMAPPVLTVSRGRREGVKHYAVALKLISSCALNEQAAKERQWAQLEDTAARICLLVGENVDVRCVTGEEYSPAEFSLTASGELSLSVNFNVQMNF